MNGFLETVVAQRVCHKINVFGWEQSLDYTAWIALVLAFILGHYVSMDMFSVLFNVFFSFCVSRLCFADKLFLAADLSMVI